MASRYKANEKLIAKIKDKFGSIQRFIAVSGLSERLVRVNLYRDTPGARDAQQLIAQVCEQTPRPGRYHLTASDRERIRLEIYKRYHNVTGFVHAHPEYSESYMSYLLSGGIKCRKGKADEVMAILKL